jgi:hypothetical protein
VAGDEERFEREVRKASAGARQSLEQARSHVTAAPRLFNKGILSDPLSKKLGKHKSYSNHYKELQAALKGVEAAIARAEAACDALDAAKP